MANYYMASTVKLSGTDLVLYKGERVSLTPATNIPDGYAFAAPLRNKWADGITRSPGTSILIEPSDVLTEAQFRAVLLGRRTIGSRVPGP